MLFPLFLYANTQNSKESIMIYTFSWNLAIYVRVLRVRTISYYFLYDPEYVRNIIAQFDTIFSRPVHPTRTATVNYLSTVIKGDCIRR